MWLVIGLYSTQMWLGLWTHRHVKIIPDLHVCSTFCHQQLQQCYVSSYSIQLPCYCALTIYISEQFQDSIGSLALKNESILRLSPSYCYTNRHLKYANSVWCPYKQHDIK